MFFFISFLALFLFYFLMSVVLRPCTLPLTTTRDPSSPSSTLHFYPYFFTPITPTAILVVVFHLLFSSLIVNSIVSTLPSRIYDPANASLLSIFLSSYLDELRVSLKYVLPLNSRISRFCFHLKSPHDNSIPPAVD